MNKNMLISVVLVVFVVVAAVQAFQLTGLKTKLEGNELSTAKSRTVKPAVKSSGGGSDVSVPKSLENLPQMVGGC